MPGPPKKGDDDDDVFDPEIVKLYLECFLDEWQYRAIHAGLVTECTRTYAVTEILNLFQAHEFPLTDDEKRDLATGDQSDLIDVLVAKMTPTLFKAVQHFTLQLQLTVCTATRVRSALEEYQKGDDPKEIIRAIEDGDHGITQQILRQAVIEATSEAADVKAVSDSWMRNMHKRLDRLTNTAEQTTAAQRMLEELNEGIAQFAARQLERSRNAVLCASMKSDKGLLKSTLGSWRASLMEHKADKEIHDMYRKQIDEAETQLMQMKMSRIENIRQMMSRSAESAVETLVADIVKAWSRCVEDAKEQARLQGDVEAQVAKLAELQQAKKDSAKQLLERMNAGSDSSLKTTTFKAWVDCMDELRKDREAEAQAAALAQQLEEALGKHKDGQKGVLGKFAATSDKAIVESSFGAWADLYWMDSSAKKYHAKMDCLLDQLHVLKSKQLTSAEDMCSKDFELQVDAELSLIFGNWQMYAELERMSKYYQKKLQKKSQKLTAVKTLFNQLANDLGEMGLERDPTKDKPGGPEGSTPALSGAETPGHPATGSGQVVPSAGKVKQQGSRARQASRESR